MNRTNYWENELLTKFKKEVMKYITKYVWKYGNEISNTKSGKCTTITKELSIREFCKKFPYEGLGFVLATDVNCGADDDVSCGNVFYHLTKITVTMIWKTEKTINPAIETKLFRTLQEIHSTTPTNISVTQEEQEISVKDVTVESLVEILNDFDNRIMSNTEKSIK